MSIHPVNKHVGERIKLAVKSSDMSVTTFAREMGVSRQIVYDWFDGSYRLRVDTLWRVANLFALDVSWFLKGMVEDD